MPSIVLANVRRHLNLTLREAALRAGVRRSTLHDLESGRSALRAPRAAALLRRLCAPLGEGVANTFVDAVMDPLRSDHLEAVSIAIAKCYGPSKAGFTTLESIIRRIEAGAEEAIVINRGLDERLHVSTRFKPDLPREDDAPTRRDLPAWHRAFLRDRAEDFARGGLLRVAVADDVVDALRHRRAPYASVSRRMIARQVGHLLDQMIFTLNAQLPIVPAAALREAFAAEWHGLQSVVVYPGHASVHRTRSGVHRVHVVDAGHAHRRVVERDVRLAGDLCDAAADPLGQDTLYDLYGDVVGAGEGSA